MLSPTIAKSVDILAPKTELPTGWNAHLPHSADIALNTGQRLIVAACHPNHLFSLVEGDQVASTIVNLNDQENQLTVKIRLLKSQISNANANPVPTSQSDRRLSSPNGGHRSNSTSNGLRDPNAPPGFEFETLPSSGFNATPGLQFNPDSDRLPPGGRYPGLGPMMGTGATNPFYSGEGGDMHPQLGSSRRPNVRYDPTSPFDSSPFNNPSFGPGNF